MHLMLSKFIKSINIDEYTSELDFSDSYITIYDHHLGDEVLKQTNIEQKFLEFAGVGKFVDMFGGEDEEVSGSVMAGLSNSFAFIMEDVFRHRGYHPILVRKVSLLLKSTQWWADNKTQISKTLQKNRYKLNLMRDILDS
jgi:hypothetical protein